MLLWIFGFLQCFKDFMVQVLIHGKNTVHAIQCHPADRHTKRTRKNQDCVAQALFCENNLRGQFKLKTERFLTFSLKLHQKTSKLEQQSTSEKCPSFEGMNFQVF